MKKILLPIALAVSVVLGVLIGNILALNSKSNRSDSAGYYNMTGNKIDALLELIDKQYVDTVNMNELSEKVISEVLSNLDPHSTYIPADELQMVNDDLESSFSGIGVQFNIQRDTIMVVAVIHGGPSEKLGIQPGDRIVEVDDSAFVGKKITSDMVVKKLRGPKNTKVKVGIKRFGSDELLHYTITRGDVPTNSVDVSYMIDGNIGYVKVSKFGSATYSEFYTALANLWNEGARSYIVDLRENSGGYLDAAINMINEFLHKDDVIVYTEGKAQKKEIAYANGNGTFQEAPLAVLIDEWSASASEIFAGAMQDNDRATVIGRRSFGKGLVQQQIPMRDGSAIRLTIARYYTPSGRCIQKPYDDKEEYRKEVLERYAKGEMDTDTMKVVTDSVEYHTVKGRVVYGGGGITPDVIVVRDTIGVTPYYTKLYNTGTLYEYSFRYVDQYRSELFRMTQEQLCAYLDRQDLGGKAMEYGETKGIKSKSEVSDITKQIIAKRVKEYVVRNILGDAAFYSVINSTDNMMKVALEKLKK